MKVLITGINGFLGSKIAKTLSRDFEIIGLESKESNLNRISEENFKVYKTHQSLELLDQIFKKENIFSVIHVATVYEKTNSLNDMIQTNILLPVNLMELSVKYNCKLFINTDSFFTSLKEDYNYLTDYTHSKKQALFWLKQIRSGSSFKLVNLRIFHMYGPNDRAEKFISTVFSKIKNNVPSIDLTPGDQARDFVHVDDVANAYKQLILNYVKLPKFKEYDLGTGVSHTIKKVVKLIKEQTSSKTKLNFGKLHYREGEVMNSKADISDLMELGWKPDINIEDGLKTLS